MQGKYANSFYIDFSNRVQNSSFWWTKFKIFVDEVLGAEYFPEIFNGTDLTHSGLNL